MAKKRTAPRAAARKSAKSAKGAKKKTAPKKAVKRTATVTAGAAYVTKAGVDLRPLKKAIRLTIERLAKSKETPKVASALESLVAVQQRLSADCNPTMVLPNS